MDAKLLNDSIVAGRKLLRNVSTPDALVGRDCLSELVEAAAKWVEAQSNGPIRVFIEGGLVQSIENIPEGLIVRRIDMDIEGEPIEDTLALDTDDVPEWADKRRTHRAYVADFYPDGSSRKVGEGGHYAKD